MKRLSILGLLGAVVGCSGLRADPAAQAQSEKLAWMSAWMQPQRTPEGMLFLGRFADPVYFVIRPISWRPNPTQVGLPVVQVPAGFVTDLASIPRIFWSLLRPDGNYAYASVIHDYLYWEQPESRLVADTVFRLCMEDFGVAPATTEAIYQAVRLGGGSAWDDNATRKKGGERRILTRYPTDPTVRWEDWRKADAF